MKKYSKIAVAIFILLVVIFGFRNCTPKSAYELLGTDKNRDGLRDDVEAYVENKYGKDKKIFLIVRELSKAIQNKVFSPENVDSIQVSKTMYCLHHFIERDHQRGLEILQDVQAAIFNTYPRIRAYAKYNARLNGKILANYDGDLKSACAFDPTLLK